MKNLIFSIKNFISKLFPPACYQMCYKERKQEGYAVFGMCCGFMSGDNHTEYIPCTCVDCPYLVKILEEE